MEIKVTMLILFFISMTVIGVYARKHTSSVDGFVLGGRKAGPWLSAFAYGTSYFSAVVFVGYAGQFGWKYGLSSTWIGIGNALIGSLLAWMILGKRTRIMTQHLQTRTMPEFFEKRYGDKRLKIAASAIIFCFLIPYTASIYNGLSRLFEMAFHVPYAYCVVTMAVFTGIYVILGGYMATAMNDLLQGIIMLGGIVAVIFAVLKGQGGLWEAIRGLSQIPGDLPAGEAAKGAFASFSGPDPLNLAGVVVLTSLGTWGLPQMVGKFYAIKDEKSIQAGTVISTLFALVVAGGCYFLGGFGRLFDSPVIRGSQQEVLFDRIIPHMLSSLPDALIGIVIVLVLSASMSTLASLVLTSSSTLTLDFLKESTGKEMSEKTQVLTMRICIVLFIGISVIFALRPPVFIAQMMGISWGALAGAFLAPFLYGLYWKQVTVQGVWAGFVMGVGFTVGNLFFPMMASPINAGSFAMILGLIVVPVVSILTRVPQKEYVDTVFSCYEE